jgi:hypothetical protein
MPKPTKLELTEKSKFALAYALAGYIASGMDHEDLIEYYVDTQAAFFINNQEKMMEELKIHEEDVQEFLSSMIKELK